MIVRPGFFPAAKDERQGCKPHRDAINIRRTNESGSAATIGEAGYSNRIVNAHAEIMKSPSSVASMKYSGRWERDARSMMPIRRGTLRLLTKCQLIALSSGEKWAASEHHPSVRGGIHILYLFAAKPLATL